MSSWTCRSSSPRRRPSRRGLALHLGAALDLPSVGVTHRPLLAHGDWPADKAGAVSPLVLDGVVVGYWLRSRAGMRPIAVHAGWRTGPETATALVLGALPYCSWSGIRLR